MQLFIRLFIRGKTKRYNCLFICLFTFWCLGTRTPLVWYKKMAFFAFFVELRGGIFHIKRGYLVDI